MDKWIVGTEEEEKKLIPFLKQKYKEQFTLKQIRFAIEHNRCSINGIIERFASRRVRKGDEIEIEVLPHYGFSFEKERLLFEDEHFIVYDKPPFIASTYGLDEALQEHFGTLYPVHRLDRDTSGALIFAKTKESQNRFEQLFRQRLVKKNYHAIVLGCPLDNKGVVEMQLETRKRVQGKVFWGASKKMASGKYSKTFWRVEKRGKLLSLLTCIPITGRTHQIRIHLNNIGFPILGDVDYGSRKLPPFLKPTRLMLHASELFFSHPFSGEEIKIKVPFPDDFRHILKKINEKIPSAGPAANVQ